GLVRRRRIDGRAILGAHIIALTHTLSGVMLFPEGLEQSFKGNHLGVKDDLDRLCMTGTARADFFISRVWRVATLIADSCNNHARQFPEQPLSAPKASKAKIDGLATFGIGSLERRAIDEVIRCDGHFGCATG